MRVEPELAFERRRRREGRLDGGDHPGRVVGQVTRQHAPFFQRGVAERAVLGDELVFGPPELRFQRLQLRGHPAQLGVGHEVSEAVQERERVGFDQGMRPAFDQGQRRCGFLGQQPFVPETDEPLRDLVRGQSEVFRPELLVRPPVTDGHIEEHTLAGEDWEEWVHTLWIRRGCG